MNHSFFQNFSRLSGYLFLMSFCLSCGYDAYLVGSSTASYEELFVSAHELLKMNYDFETVDKTRGTLETQWLVVPNVDSFGSERHRIIVRVLDDGYGGGIIYLRVDVESREQDPISRGVPDWIPQGRDESKEEYFLDLILKNVNF